MMMWADALHRFGGISESLPSDVIYMEWGYEKEYPFLQRCRELAKAKKRFYVCPGTSSWNSFTGLTENMMANIDRAMEAAEEYGAEGILLTDWGDNCHMQYFPVSYGPILYCGALSWNRKTAANETWLAEVLDTFVFQDKSRQMGRAALEAGEYNLLEERQFPCRTLAATIYIDGIRDIHGYVRAQIFADRTLQVLTPLEVSRTYLTEHVPMNLTNIRAVLEHCDQVLRRLKKTDMQCRDAALIREEFANGTAMVKGFTLWRASFLTEGEEKEEWKRQAKGLLLEAAERHRILWRSRNKESGLEEGLKKMLFLTEGEETL